MPYITKFYSIPKERVANIICEKRRWHAAVADDGSLTIRDDGENWVASLRDYPLPSYVKKEGGSTSVTGSIGTTANIESGWSSSAREDFANYLSKYEV